MENKLYAQYGCGLSAPKEWKNFDVSPTLRLQRIPILGNLIKGQLNVVFPDNVLYGNIISGLPVADNSCDGVYCSHTLEHLSLMDFRTALKNTYRIMKKGGIFRCVVPDLESAARHYIDGLKTGTRDASLQFMQTTILGVKQRPKGLRGVSALLFGNANHLWMWDNTSLAYELEKAGFTDIRVCHFNDSEDDMFRHVEDETRFFEAAAIQCKK